MKIILDTCVLSELGKDDCHMNVHRVISEFSEDDLYLSVITIGEVTKGVSLLAESRRKQELRSWLQTIERDYSDRILPIDMETTRIWGEITAKAQKEGKTVGASDGLIAATAMRNGFHVMTRNINDFKPTGVLLVNPWSG